MTTPPTPSGFLPDASGGPGARFGRDPVTGRAYKADGTVRAARTTLTPAERLAAVADAQSRAYATLGRQVADQVPGLAGTVAAAATLTRWVRECRAYGTPEARAERVAYHKAMLAAVEGKGKAAEAFLAGHAEAAEAVADLYATIGRMVSESGRTPSEAEVLAGLPKGTLAALRDATRPEADPLAPWRRDAAEPEAAQ